MIKKQKTLIIVFGALFVVMLVLYFAVIRPLTTVEDDGTVTQELLPGEVQVTAKTTNIYIFEPLQRSEIQSIEVTNEYGGYKIYRDSSDTFQLEGCVGLSFDPEIFSSLIVSAGTPTAMMRVATDLTPELLAEYGLDEPQASWTVTSTLGEKFTMYVGDELVTEGGYYVKYADRDAAYIVSTTLADTILQPAKVLLQPLLTAGMSQNNYFYVDNFSVWHGEDLFVHIQRVPDEEKKNPDAITEIKMTYPLPEGGGNGVYYEANDNLYFQILYNFIALTGDSVECYLPTEEQAAEYGLDEPAYTIAYTFEDYQFFLFVSEQQPDGTYYATSNLFGYNIICKVSNELLGWLENDTFAWIFPTPFFVNITEVARITLKNDKVDVDFRLTHSVDADSNAVLDVVEVNSGVEIPNAEVKNFREYYKTMLNITNQEYALLSAEDRAALISDDNRLVLTMTYENTSGDEFEYKFYQYYASSTDKLSTGKIFVVVNGAGEFYTTNDLVDKVVNDTSRVLNGLDVDAYGHN
ncbi:MAG: DUF4340 domain-containing protein [Eubacteriales bacterium]